MAMEYVRGKTWIISRGVFLFLEYKQVNPVDRANGQIDEVAREHYLSESYFHRYLEENRHETTDLQSEYDKRFGLVP